MKRVVLLGCAGAGKTTFSRRLGEAMGAPVICLDALWRPDWGPEKNPDFRAMLAELHAGHAWVSDGNFAKVTFDLRMTRADLVIWLETPPPLCAWRAATRVLRSGEAHRPSDLFKVLRFIWSFDRVNRPRIEALRRQYGPAVPVVRLRSRADVENFLGEVS